MRVFSVDVKGNIDILELKKPFGKSIVGNTKYRENYIPLRELSGTIMQVEKYIFYLNKWGRDGEKKLTKNLILNKKKGKFPNGFSIKIVNPKAIIIMGRENGLNKNQMNDFEIIKRKYKNIIDILTYDELLNRLKIKFNFLGKYK